MGIIGWIVVGLILTVIAFLLTEPLDCGSYFWWQPVCSALVIIMTVWLSFYSINVGTIMVVTLCVGLVFFIDAYITNIFVSVDFVYVKALVMFGFLMALFQLICKLPGL